MGLVLKFWAAHLHQIDFKVTTPTPFPRPFASNRSPIQNLVYNYHTTKLEMHDKKMEKRGFISQALDNAKLNYQNNCQSTIML